MGSWPQQSLTDEQVEDIVGAMADAGYGLTYDDAQGLIKKTRQGPNPYDAAQTFAESDVTVTKTDTVVESGSVALSKGGLFVDDFEDGDIQGWSGSTSYLSAQTNTVLAGSYSGEFAPPASNTTVTSPSVGGSSENAVFKYRVGNQTGNSSDESDIRFYDSSGTDFALIEFQHDGKILFQNTDSNSYTQVGTWSQNTTYTIELAWDFANDQVDVIIDGSTAATDLAMGPQDGTWDYVDWHSYTNASGTAVTKWADRPAPATSGSAIIEWPAPSDVYEWDVATFTRTLDGETVDVFVAYDDGTGWTRTNSGNPISRNYSLADDSNISPSDAVRLEIDLSRANTSNNPTLDSAYRSWVV